MEIRLPECWHAQLDAELNQPYFQNLSQFVDQERQKGPVFPPEPEVFSALQLTPYKNVRVLLLGQDPYHDDNQAHGLSFSVKPGIKPPPSLVNMFKEMREDVGTSLP